MAIVHKKFKLDKAILRSIIAEQAGEVVNAISEMVMNSIDAGATQIDIQIDANKFKVSDNGRGFTSLQEIENNFETFGTPREESSEYGCFRMGRGQILNISKTYWRSANYSMEVDLEGSVEEAYLLGEHEDYVNGCIITGEFYTSLNIHEGVQNIQIFENDLQKVVASTKKPKDVYKSLLRNGFGDKLIKYFSLVKTPVFINGFQISNLIELELVKETDFAKYYKSPLKSSLINFNKGIYISNHSAQDSLIIDYKKSPILNIARNQINRECNIFKQSEKERAEYIIELATKGIETKSIGLFTTYSNFICRGISDRNLSVFEAHLYSLISKANVHAIMNSIPVHTYNNGKVDIYGFLDFCEMSQAMPSNFIFNTFGQSQIMKTIPNGAISSFLNDYAESRIIVGSPAFDTNEISFNLAQYIRSFDSSFSLKVEINRHTLFRTEEDFSSYRKKLKSKAKRDVALDIQDSELRELVECGYIEASETMLESNHTHGIHFNQIVQEIKQIIIDLANEIRVEISPEININNDIRVIFANDYTSNVFEYKNRIYLVIHERRLERQYDFVSMILSMLMSSIGNESEHFNDIYDDFESNEICVKVIEHFNAYGVDIRLSELNRKIYEKLPAMKLDYENKNRIKTIHAVIDVLKDVDIEAHNALKNHSKSFNTIAV